MLSFRPEDLAHLAKLARLEPAGETLPQYTAQVEAILALFEALQPIDTSGVGEVLASFPDLRLVPRPDIPGGSLPRDAALAPSQRRDGDYLTVPRVLGGAEEGE